MFLSYPVTLPQDLKSSVPNMELRNVQGSCGTAQLLTTMLAKLSLSAGGGIYIGESVVLTRIPEVASNRNPFWFAFAETPSDVTRGIVWVNRGLDETTRTLLAVNITASKPSCVGTASYRGVNASRGASSSAVCVKVADALAPRDVWEARTDFAELARRLFYGTGRALTVVNGTGEAIPRLSHYVWLRSGGSALYGREFTFSQFLSVLSALYVGGFRRVWVHGDSQPAGDGTIGGWMDG